MLAFYEVMKEIPTKELDKYLDSKFWHACAGGMVQMPSVNSKVYYFPQGHAEHAQGVLDFGFSQRIPALILCRVSAIKFMADRETDEVFTKIHLVPVRTGEPDFGDENCWGLGVNGIDAQEKPASFSKTLTQSDANNGGGFSVPRYCAETIFPRLDYSVEPPVQTVLAKDVHGEVWKFRHIYRGTPRRHLLTTGWNTFVNQKKLVAGDSIVFLRTPSGDLCVGIRRAKRGRIVGLPESSMGWNPPNGGNGSFSAFLKEEESKLMKGHGNNAIMSLNGGLRADAVFGAATLAANEQPFEVVYYPRASTPEFCVRATSVKAAMMSQWCPGMRFKMPFETEDSSRISWFMGTIASVQIVDPIRWPNSPWRVLQVTWDEPDFLQNVKCVSPWLVELVSNMPVIYPASFSPPEKKLRILPQHDFSVESHLPTPMFPGYHHLGLSSPLCCFRNSTPVGVQGARHAKFGASLLDHHLNTLQTGLFPAGYHQLNHISPPPRMTTGLTVGNQTIHDNVSCLLTIGCHQSAKKPTNRKPSNLMLFGKSILIEEQMPKRNSGDTLSPGATGNSSCDGNPEKATNVSSCSGSAINQSQVVDNSFSEGWHKTRWALKHALETSHCKVFLESDDVGRTLDLSALSSFDDLCERLAEMFRMEKTELMSRVLYKDEMGAVKNIGNVSFSDFLRSTRTLTILTNSGSDKLGS